MLGPSGSGKTTLLRIIAGFVPRRRGTVVLGGVDVTREPPYARNVNTVFQDYALFPHMTVQRERRVRAAGQGRRPRRAAPARPAGARRWCGCPITARASRPALRRPAPARRARPRDRQRAGGAAARRAARRARPEAAPGDAARAQADPARGRHHLHLRHPRPGGGADDERPAGRDRTTAGSSSWASPIEVYEQPANEFVAGFIGVSNLLERDGRRFTIRPEKVRLYAIRRRRPLPGAARGAGRDRRGHLPRAGDPLRRRASTRGETADRAPPEPRDSGGRGARQAGPGVSVAWRPGQAYKIAIRFKRSRVTEEASAVRRGQP